MGKKYPSVIGSDLLSIQFEKSKSYKRRVGSQKLDLSKFINCPILLLRGRKTGPYDRSPGTTGGIHDVKVDMDPSQLEKKENSPKSAL